MTWLALALLGLPASGQEGDVQPGLFAEYFQFDRDLDRIPRLDAGMRPAVTRIDRNIDFRGDGGFAGTNLENRFYARWSGFLRIPADGRYRFFLGSDDGSRLLLDGRIVVDNDGLHSEQETHGDAELKKGDVPVLVEFFDNYEAAVCRLSWQPPGRNRATVPESALFHARAAAGSLDALLVPPAAEWRYRAERKDPEGDWHEPGYADDGWKKGRAGFGFGKKGDRTRVNIRDVTPRVYLRRAFDVDDPARVKKLSLHVRYDDGFIAYLNGVEVKRASIRSGRGAGAEGISEHDAGDGPERFDLSSARRHLRRGRNVLAIEAHNQKIGSIDFTIDPYLVAGDARVEPLRPPPPPPPKEFVVKGTLDGALHDRISMDVVERNGHKAGGEVKVYVDGSTEILLRGKRVGPEELRVGWDVTVRARGTKALHVDVHGDPPDLVRVRVEAAFPDDPFWLVQFHVEDDEKLPVYIRPDTKVTYTDIRRADRMPKAGHYASVWLKPGSRDTARRVAFRREPNR